MQRLWSTLRARFTLSLIGLAGLVFGFLLFEELELVLANIDWVGVGASGLTTRFGLALSAASAIAYRAYEQAQEERPRVYWFPFVRDVFMWLIVLPVSILIGRIVCVYIPPWDPLIGVIVFPVLAWYFLHGLELPHKAAPTIPEFRRGSRNLTTEEAEKRAAALRDGQTELLEWAGFRLPTWTAEGHFCVVGAPGAGKTLMIRSLMRSVLPHITPESDRRAIVYDVKLDAVSELSHMGLACPIQILNPFDTRCFSWDMAADLTDPNTADQYAAIFFPGRGGDAKDNYFTEAAQALVGGVLQAFIITNKRWTLRDLILVTAEGPRLRQALELSPHTAARIGRYFKPEDTFHNVLSTIANVMVRLEGVAAIWHNTPPERRFSINEWCRTQSSVLVLGRQFERSETLTLLNQIIFRRISELLLSGDESPTRWKTWFFIDELKEGGQLHGLPELLTNGRSKGVRIALGFQDIEGLRQTYGEHIANEMPGMCANRSILHLRSSFTAQWASDQLGEVENFEFVTSLGTSRDQHGNVTTSTNTTKNIEARRALLPSEFMSFALSRDGQVYGCHVIPALEGFVGKVTQHPLHNGLPIDNFNPRSDSTHMLLPPWTAEDDKRFGFRISTVTDRTDQPAQKAPPQRKSSPLDQMGRMKRDS